MDIWELNRISYKIIGAAIEVHRNMGPGLNERIYEECMLLELAERGLLAESQVIVPVKYKQHDLEAKYVIDLLIEKKIIIELKAVSELHPIHAAQLLSYMKLTGKDLGLLINFNVKILKQGVTRYLKGLPENIVPFNLDSL